MEHINCLKHGAVPDDDPVSAPRGLFYGLILAVMLWVLIFGAWWWFG